MGDSQEQRRRLLYLRLEEEFRKAAPARKDQPGASYQITPRLMDLLIDRVRVVAPRGGRRPPGVGASPTITTRYAVSGEVRSRDAYLGSYEDTIEQEMEDAPEWAIEVVQAALHGRPPFEFLTAGDPALVSFAPRMRFKYRNGRVLAVTQRVPTKRSARHANVIQPNYHSLSKPEYWDATGMQYWGCADDYPPRDALMDAGLIDQPNWGAPIPRMEEDVGRQIFLMREPIQMRGEAVIPVPNTTLQMYHKKSHMLLLGTVVSVYTGDRRVGHVELDACQTIDTVWDGSWKDYQTWTELRSRRARRSDL